MKDNPNFHRVHGMWTVNGFVRNDLDIRPVRKVDPLIMLPPELIIGLPLLVAILYLLARMVGLL